MYVFITKKETDKYELEVLRYLGAMDDYILVLDM